MGILKERERPATRPRENSWERKRPSSLDPWYLHYLQFLGARSRRDWANLTISEVLVHKTRRRDRAARWSWSNRSAMFALDSC